VREVLDRQHTVFSVSDMHPPGSPMPAGTTASAGPASFRSSLTFGHVLAGMSAEYGPAVSLKDVHVIRHTFQPGNPDGLRGPGT
jgi:hypothetical protein